MAQQIINVGDVANDGQGDPLRDAFIKCNDNFTELYDIGGLTGIQNGNSNIRIAEDSVITMSSTGVANVIIVADYGMEVAGLVSASGNVSGAYLYGNGRYLTGVVSSAAASALTGNVLSSNVTSSSLNSVGVLANLSVAGNTVSGNAIITNSFNAVGETGFGANVTVSRNLTVGLLTTANTLSVANAANFSTATASGNIVAANFSSNNSVSAVTINATSSISTAGNVTAGRVNTSTISGTGVSIRSTGDLSLSATGNINVNGGYINNLATPTQASDATNKAYVDGMVSGLNIHSAANLATTTDLGTWTSATVVYNNGSSGVGATLSIVGNTLTALDGVSIPANARLLVKNQANAVLNGVYDYTSSTLLTRSTDFDDTTGAGAGSFLFVQQGVVNASTGWSQTTPTPEIGVSNLVFTQFSGAGSYTAGTGLALSGTTFYIANTSVAQGSYGNSTAIPQFTVNPQGQLTAANTVAVIAPAGTLTGTTLNATVVNSSLTTVGTLTSLSVTGNVTGGNISTGGQVSATGSIRGSNLLASGVISATGNITGGNLLSSTLSLSGNVLSSLLTTESVVGGTLISNGAISATGNITGSSASLSGSVTSGANVLAAGLISAAGNITGSYLYGNGRNLTGLAITSIANGLASVSTYSAGNSSVVIDVNGRTLTFEQSILDPTKYGITLSADYLDAQYADFSANNISFGYSLVGSVISVVGSVSANLVAGNTINGTTLSVSGSVTSDSVTTGNISAGNISASGDIVAANSISTNSIIHIGANATGNIGSESSYFDTFFGTAINALYADLAESYSADRDYGPGTVLSFGGTREVTLSTIDGDRRIAGVVSTHPAHLMNSAIDAEFPVAVALQGRVPCSVVGAVRKGDMMVSAGNGCARSEDNPRMGTVIGKALENFDGTSGVIEVVVGRL